jgi:transmembrane sensor
VAELSPAPGRPGGALDPHVLAEAAQWFATLRDDRVDDASRRQWRDWIAANPQHRQAWERVEAIGGQFDRLPARAARAALSAPSRRRRHLLGMVALGSGGCLAVTFGRDALPWQAWTAAYRTGVGETRDLRLADGTQVWLNTASAIDVADDDAWRRVLLRQGEVLIESAPDPRRPLVVEVTQGRLRALGTRFTVRQDGASCHVAVFDGAVEVTPAGAASQVVPAGKQLRFDATAVGALEPAEPRRQAWRTGMLLADNQRLDAFLAELSRYRHGRLGCAQEVAQLRLVGAYPLADTDRILQALAGTLPVRVRTFTGWWVSVEAA